MDAIPRRAAFRERWLPPIPPDEAGDPQAVTIDYTQIPPVPPYVAVPMAPYNGPKTCKTRHSRSTSPHKKCKKKRQRAK
jgi:hypothetical protein